MISPRICVIITKKLNYFLLRMTVMKKYLFVSYTLFLILLFQQCSLEKKVTLSPQQKTEFEHAIKKADELYKKGSYFSLKKAFETYEFYVDFPVFRQKTRTKLLKTALLISLRQSELSIIDHDYIEKAAKMAKLDPALSEFNRYVEAVQHMIGYSGGPSLSHDNDDGEDAELDRFFNWARDNASLLNSKLQKSAPYDEFFAYIYITFQQHLSYWIKNKKSVLELRNVFPDSLLIQFKLSIYPRPDPIGLQKIIDLAPDFFEALCFLGRHELQQGRILSAEKNLLLMNDFIPDSISNTLSLTKIYFLLEEFDKCLEFNEKILKLSLTHRNALLGKAISLSFLGRHKEAATICRTLLQLGKYNMGESHYWLAWNDKELKDLDAAWDNAQKSKKYLIGHPELYFLSGTIAYERGDLKIAEKEFKEALNIKPGYCEVLFYLGNISATKGDWKESGVYYKTSAQCNQGQETVLINKIQEIEASSFSENRKQKHIHRKKLQIAGIRLAKATSYYNAAAGFFNANMYEESLSQAQEAAKHANFKEKAEELISSIRNIKK